MAVTDSASREWLITTVNRAILLCFGRLMSQDRIGNRTVMIDLLVVSAAIPLNLCVSVTLLNTASHGVSLLGCPYGSSVALPVHCVKYQFDFGLRSPCPGMEKPRLNHLLPQVMQIEPGLSVCSIQMLRPKGGRYV